MDKKVLIDLALKFVSRKFAAAGLTIYQITEKPDLALVDRLIAAGIGIAYIVIQGWLDGKKLEKTGKVDDEVTGGSSTPVVPAIFFALILGAALLVVPISANAEILPYIDRLDLQVGPGIEIVSFDPFTIEEVLLGTAKVYERWGIEARIGGLLSDSRRALVFNAARNLTDLVLRNDGGENKALLPTIGLWCAGDLVSSDDGRKTFEFAWGFNAVLAEY